MITYLIVIYKNYKLLELQRKIFKNLFKDANFKFIIVDNTPDIEKQPIEKSLNELVVYRNSVNEFDGVSHGSAINYGLSYLTTDIVCILDSDFFIVNPNITNYITKKFNEGFVAVGAEFNDGIATKSIVNKFPEKFYNIPCCFCGFYSKELALSNSWVVYPQEVSHATSFIEVGWRIRKHIIDNKLKTLAWNTYSNTNNNCVFVDECNNTMGIHFVGGSHRKLNFTLDDFYNEIRGFYNDE